MQIDLSGYEDETSWKGQNIVYTVQFPEHVTYFATCFDSIS